MTPKVSTYKRQLLLSLSFQRSGNYAAEDLLLARMDALWLSMTRAERVAADEIARLAGQGITAISERDYNRVSTTSGGAPEMVEITAIAKSAVPARRVQMVRTYSRVTREPAFSEPTLCAVAV